MNLKLTTIKEGGDVYQFVIQGTGEYTILLESGLDDDLSTWNPIFNKLSKTTRVFAYNRSGYGMAKMSNKQKDANSVAENLMKLLRSNDIKGPYIVMGHSLGGQYSLAFANLYPEDVAEIVLLDTRPPEFDTKCTEREIGLCEVPKPVYLLWSKHVKKEYDDSRLYNESQLSDLKNIKHTPLIVITRDKNKGMESQKFKDFWNEMQHDMLNLSDNSKYYEIKNSGHYVYKKEPSRIVDIVTNSIKQIDSK